MKILNESYLTLNQLRNRHKKQILEHVIKIKIGVNLSRLEFKTWEESLKFYSLKDILVILKTEDVKKMKFLQIKNEILEHKIGDKNETL